MSLRPYAIGAITGAALALAIAWFWRQQPAPEPPADEKQLPSGGLLIRRDPEAKPPEPVKRAAKEAQGKLERSISVVVQPEPITQPSTPLSHTWNPAPESFVLPPTFEGEKINMPCTCAPVTVDLGLIRMPDRTRRVVATAQGGKILSAIDIPLDTAPAKTLRWAAGVSVSFDETGRRGYGAWVDRDLGPLRLGVEVQQRREGVAGVVRAGIRF